MIIIAAFALAFALPAIVFGHKDAPGEFYSLKRDIHIVPGALSKHFGSGRCSVNGTQALLLDSVELAGVHHIPNEPHNFTLFGFANETVDIRNATVSHRYFLGTLPLDPGEEYLFHTFKEFHLLNGSVIPAGKLALPFILDDPFIRSKSSRYRVEIEALDRHDKCLYAVKIDICRIRKIGKIPIQASDAYFAPSAVIQCAVQ